VLEAIGIDIEADGEPSAAQDSPAPAHTPTLATRSKTPPVKSPPSNQPRAEQVAALGGDGQSSSLVTGARHTTNGNTHELEADSKTSSVQSVHAQLAFLREEVARLTAENVALREQNEKLQKVANSHGRPNSTTASSGARHASSSPAGKNAAAAAPSTATQPREGLDSSDDRADVSPTGIFCCGGKRKSKPRGTPPTHVVVPTAQ
jgi:uncharacterized small protein (DUF1192 family)